MGVIIIDEKAFATLIIILAILFLIRTIFRFINCILKSIWSLFRGKSKRKNLLESDDWLTRAQARQEIRFENSLPPMSPKQTPQRRNEKCKKDVTRYPSGWTLNQETGLWEPPDYISPKSEQPEQKSEIRWKWIPEKNIWIDTHKK